MSKIYFFTGGVRSGKSAYAEDLAGNLSCKVGYIATGIAIDDEMKRRIEVHKKRRPEDWSIFELNDAIKIKDFEKILNNVRNAGIKVLIIDCITNLLFRLIYDFNKDGLLDRAELIDNKLEDLIEKKTENFFECILKLLREAAVKFGLNIIIVSNEVGMGIVPPYPFGRIFRDMLGLVNKKFAECADEVLFFVSGLNIKIK